jgi:hypothetical protein
MHLYAVLLQIKKDFLSIGTIFAHKFFLSQKKEPAILGDSYVNLGCLDRLVWSSKCF